jgi:thiol:disulfide interchange protein
VLVSFAVVAGALIGLRAGGEQLGWGFQLQSPAFVTLLAWLFFVLALSFSGVILVGGRLAGAGQRLAGRSGYAGSFATGALATVAATPCTAPFMGTAVGFAVTQPWPTALLVFEALGLGLALPYLLLTLVPAWSRFLPKPGRWMARLQQFLAFPLYASAAWLVWVVSQQAGPRGVGVALAGIVLIAFASWLHQSLGAVRPSARSGGGRRPWPSSRCFRR